jgi:hypothetical protein
MLEMFEEKYGAATEEAFLFAMVPLALFNLSRLCRDALSSGKHQPDDWKLQGISGNMDHLIAHFGAIEMTTGDNCGQSDEYHLLNMVCRGLMVLQLREEQKNAGRP